MIRLKEPGERGGYMLVEMTPFDLISLQECLSFASNHLQHLEEDNPSRFELLGFHNKLKDVHANYNELENVKKDRERILTEAEEKSTP